MEDLRKGQLATVPELAEGPIFHYIFEHLISSELMCEGDLESGCFAPRYMDFI